MRRLRELVRSIKNLCIWFKVIWSDRYWDQHYFYVILRKKLSLMEEGHRTEGHLVCSLETAHKLQLCVDLLDKLIKDEYYLDTKTTVEEDKAKQKDIDKLFEILSKNVQGFCD